MHLNFEPKIVYMQNNKQTQSLVTLCDVDRYIQQDSNTFNKNCNLFSAMFKIWPGFPAAVAARMKTVLTQEP